MRAISLFFILFFILFSGIVTAQKNGFVIFTSPKKYLNHNYTFQRGEVVAARIKQDTSSIDLFFFNDSIIGLKLPDSFRVLPYDSVINYNKFKDKIVKADNEEIIFDTKFFSKTDTLLIVPKEMDDSPTKILGDTIYRKEKSELKDSFKIIYPNSFAIYYDVAKIVEDPQKKEELVWPTYLVLGILFCGILVLLYLWVKERNKNKKGEPELSGKITRADGMYVTYLNGTLEDFAQQNGTTVDKIKELNQESLTPYFATAEQKERNRRLKKLKGKEFKIKERVSANVASKNQANNSENEITINITTLRNVFDDLGKVISKVEMQSIDLLTKSRNVEKEAKDKIGELENKIANIGDTEKRLQTKVIEVDYLSTICKNINDLLKYSAEILSEAHKVYSQLGVKGGESQNIVGLFLAKFNSSIQPIWFKIGCWQRTMTDIAETSVTNNNDAIKILRQDGPEEDKKRSFFKLLCDEFLVDYSSAVLILIEEFKNISRFLKVELTEMKECERTFSDFCNRLKEKMKGNGLAPIYISLFTNYNNYENLSLIKAVSNEHLTSPYQAVEGLVKDDIVEVKSYGFIIQDYNKTMVTEFIFKQND